MGSNSSKRGGDLPNSTPTGLYDHCEWDPKVVRRLILEKKLAPISVGKEDAIEDGLEECPICFLYYAGGLNRSRCCRKGACTECYLQVKRPNHNTTQKLRCPFCNHSQYIVTFTGPLSKEEVAQEAQEQMKVLELKINMRKEEIERDKQREQERERLRKERELNPSTTTTSNSIATTSNTRQPSESTHIRPSQSVPSNPNLQTSPFGTYGQYYFGSSYPPTIEGGPQQDPNAPPDPDLEELMLMEAIRLSLLEVQPASKDDPPKGPPHPPPHLPPPPSVSSRIRDPLFGSSDGSADSYDSDSDDVPLTTKFKPMARTPTTSTTATTTTTTTTSSHPNNNASFDSELNFAYNFEAVNPQLPSERVHEHEQFNTDDLDDNYDVGSYTDITLHEPPNISTPSINDTISNNNNSTTSFNYDVTQDGTAHNSTTTTDDSKQSDITNSTNDNDLLEGNT